MKKRAFFLVTLLCFFSYQSLFALKGVKKVKLDNGLTLLIREDHRHPVASVQVWVRAGSVNESDKINGISHFLEHLIFKGTEKYPGNQISYLVETQGGVINAATSKEFTHYYIDIQKDGVKTAIDLLADTMFNAAVPEDEMEKERLVVLEEISRHSDNPHALIYDDFSEALFVKTPYRKSIIGTSEVIKSVSRQDIMDYYHKFYCPSNMFVCVAGDINAKDITKAVKETFGKAKRLEEPSQPGLSEDLHEAVAKKAEKNIEHAYWMAGFIGPDILSSEQFAGDVTATVLVGSRSSRLYQRLREKEKLVYTIAGGFQTQRGSGATVFSAIFSPENEEKVMRAVVEETEKLMEEGPTEEELKRAKELARSQWYFANETCHDLASLDGYWNMQGNPGMIEAYIPGIERTGADDVKNFLKKYYKPQGFSRAVLLPKKQ